jgi:hypothetical protein
MIFISVDTLPLLEVVEDTLLCTIENLYNLVKYVSADATVQFYKDSNTIIPLKSSYVHILSDTVFYGQSTNTLTGCKSVIKAIHIEAGQYPPDVETTGKQVVCISDTITLQNASVGGGIWTISDPSIAKIINMNLNSVEVVGLKEGSVYISYTTGVSSCITRITFRVKVIRKQKPIIIIGIER